VLAKTGLAMAGLSAALVSSVDFNGTVGAGSVLVGMLVAVAAGITNLRTRLYRDQINGWHGNYLQEKEHAGQLEKRLEEAVEFTGQLRDELAEAKVVIQRLEQLPNLERLVKLMSDIQERQETHAQTRHLEVLGAIAAISH
jgi:biopolymer transport protein ExbB/TolQ